MVTLLGYNKEINSFVQCCYTLLTGETENIYEKYLHLLKFNYNFIPKYLTIDFSKSEENAINRIYENKTKIIFCFFHLVHCLWRRINNLSLRKKEFIKISKALIFNIKLLAFIKIDKIEESYNCIKNSELFKGEKYQEFFSYFDRNWMKKNLYSKWNYYDIISLVKNSNNENYKNEFNIKILLTNNACETLHSFIKQMVSNNNNVNVYVFNNILCNLISKNNFDSNSKRKANEINKYKFNVMKKKFSSDLFKIANINNKFKVFNFEEMMNTLKTDINEDELLLFNEN